jgi:simple sugar transport system ATP-binding protein/ribose transport system ATP-binding protein
MLGRSLGQTFPERTPPAGDSPVVLDVRDVVAPGVEGVTFHVRAGEIVGLAGLIGAGRSELARAIYGATGRVSGEVGMLGGARWDRPAGALRAGIALVPESRATEGLMLGRPVRENVSLASLWTRARSGFVLRRAERRAVADALAASTVQASPERPVATLSGGNQQKLLFARASLTHPRVLIADEPTRGIDVGAKRSIYELIATLAAAGTAVLLISSETEEILGLAHRALVMRGGRITAELAGDRMTEGAILEAAFAASATDSRAA